MDHEIDPESGLLTWHPRPLPEPPHSVAAVLDPVLIAEPDRLALVDGDRSWTYAELDGATRAMASRLAASGLDAGARMLWSTPNCAELVIAFLACQRLGAVWAAVSPRTTTTEQERVIELLDPRVAILGVEALTELPADGLELEAGPLDSQAPAAIGFTSGSTGRPKAVVHSQHGLLVPAHVSRRVEPPATDERIGTPLALTTLNMLVLGPLSAFVRGTTAIIMTRTDSVGVAAEVAEHRVTRAFVVPTILHDLVQGAVSPMDLASLRRVIAGAGGATPGVLAGFADRFGIRPTLSYGLTEAPTGIARESLDDPIGSGYGHPLPHVELSVDNDEIVVGPSLSGRWADVWTPMLGYWGDPVATATTLRAGRLHTGDRGTIDEQGRVRVVGRLDVVINRGGELISAVEVEMALLALPGVAAAHVVAMPDERLGEVVGALVVLEADASIADLEPDLPRTRRPSIVKVVGALPRSPLGKVDSTEARRLLSG